MQVHVHVLYTVHVHAGGQSLWFIIKTQNKSDFDTKYTTGNGQIVFTRYSTCTCIMAMKVIAFASIPCILALKGQ